MVSIIVLAAGRGKRMHSKIPKMLHPLLGKPLLRHGVDTALSLHPHEVVIVTSPAISKTISQWSFQGRVSTVIQPYPLGTADAVRFGLSGLSSLDTTILILPGDVPLVRTETLKALIDYFDRSQSVLTILSARVRDPFGYGRVITTTEHEVVRIVEEKDATPEEQSIPLINSGVMVIRGDVLKDALRYVGSDNAQAEFYLTDLAALLRERNLRVTTLRCKDSEEILGVNDRVQLSNLEQRLLRVIITKWQHEGVTFILPESIYLDVSVTLSRDVVLEPGVILRGRTIIGEDSRIGKGSVVEDSEIGSGVVIKPYSVVEASVVRGNAVIGPFAHLRPGSDIGPAARVGNFVEIKKSKLEGGVKASHLTYLGDTTVGGGTNIGAGTITCNYDGREKHPTYIGREVFVGSNTALVAPITVGDRALIGAGSVITKEVPPDTLAVSRVKQRNIHRRLLKKRGK